MSKFIVDNGKKIFIILCIIFALFLIILKNSYNFFENIDDILESEDYSYLSLEAKNYIRGVYEETGNLILTEKNKKDNQLYLNPQFAEYLSYSDEEKRKYGSIPPETIVDYVYGSSPYNEQLPGTFDLRNVDGKNYVTPVQNQYGGLCWAYSSTAQIESLLLMNSGQSYTDDSTIFSERQLDYAISKDGIIGGKSLYPYRVLLDGANHLQLSSVEVDGLGLVGINWEKDIGDSINKLEPSTVYNFSNSLYEVDNTVVVPNLNLATLDSNSEEDMQKREEYLNTIKGIIKNYGGAVAETISSNGKCSIPLGDTRLIYNNGECNTGGAHAMQIIGWDDNYEYSFCKNSNEISDDISSCSQSNIVSGKGAWILKNSWGENKTPYPYLAYDSYDSIIWAVKNIDTIEWDNYYYASTNIGGASYVTVEKEIENDEKIDKIKFNISTSNITNDELDVYISSNENNYQLVGSIDTDLPGYYTIDLTDKNIMFDVKTIKIKAMYGNSAIWWHSGDDVRVYTSNNNDNAYIKTEDYIYDGEYSTYDYYEIRLNQLTKGIPENSIITYKILDNNNNEINDNYSFEENIVYANRIYPKIIIDSSLSKGEYKIQTLYNGEIKSESSLIINSAPVVINGDGTSQNPYIITNPIQLNLMRKNRLAYFVLGNDIDLSYDTQNENGLFYNDGLGWEPIEYKSSLTNDKFSGSLDGKGYKIKGLYINRPDEDYVGLFKNIYSYGTDQGQEISIFNLTLEDPNITGNNYVGGIAGNIDSQSNIYLTEMENIYVIGGSITGNNYVGGIAGNFRGGISNDRYSYRINSLFNSSSVTANNYAGGIFGNVENTHIWSGMKVYIKNIINIGEVTSNGNASGLIGNVKMRHDDPINIENSLNVGIIKGKNCSSGITCQLDSEASGTLNLKNIYYIDQYGYDTTNDSISASNVSQKVGNSITDILNYSEWDSFDRIWKIETYNGLARIPMLKDMNVDYISSSIDKVVLLKSQNLNVSNSINDENQIKYTIMDTSVASIDNGVIVGKEIGNTDLIVSSKYEQLIIPVYIVSQAKYSISFDANGGTGIMDDFQLEYGESGALPSNYFTKEGYYFDHWNSKADDSGTSYSNEENVSPTDDLKLYAIWHPINYSVSWYNDDQTKSISDTNIYDVEYTATDYKWSLKEGYKFVEWNTKVDGSGTSYKIGDTFKNLATVGNSSVSIYAIVLPINYKISFDANGGTGTMDYQILTYDFESDLTKNVFIRNGYIFKEWNTKADGSGTSYSDEQKVINLLNTENEIVNLYAIWESTDYQIGNTAYHLNGDVLTGIDEDTDVDSINLMLPSGYSYSVYEGDIIKTQGNVGTGNTVKIYLNNQYVTEYTASVKGDINGDGAISVSDISMIYKNIKRKNEFSNAQVIASDVNGDGGISVSDISMIYKHIKKKINL